jgi:hypothetical protein
MMLYLENKTLRNQVFERNSYSFAFSCLASLISDTLALRISFSFGNLFFIISQSLSSLAIQSLFYFMSQ